MPKKRERLRSELLSEDKRLHTLLQRTLYSKYTLCIVTSCSKEQFASNWLVTVCFLTHFASQELNTLGSPTHLAKSQFTLQHTLLLNTLCPSEPFCFLEPFATQHILLPGPFSSSEPFASHNTFLLRTLCSSEHYVP